MDECFAPEATLDDLKGAGVAWREILSARKLEADMNHVFDVEGERASHVRLNIHPDGGVSRLRVHGVFA